MVDNLPDYSVYVIYWTVPTKLLQLQWSVHRNWCLLLGILYVNAISSYEPSHLQLWARPSPAMSYAISSHDLRHVQIWAKPSPAMSHDISSYEPQHLQLLAAPYFLIYVNACLKSLLHAILLVDVLIRNLCNYWPWPHKRKLAACHILT